MDSSSWNLLLSLFISSRVGCVYLHTDPRLIVCFGFQQPLPFVVSFKTARKLLKDKVLHRIRIGVQSLQRTRVLRLHLRSSSIKVLALRQTTPGVAGPVMTKNQTKGQRSARLEGDFRTQYGNNETRLEGWQMLCDDVGILPEASITKCKKVGQLSISTYEGRTLMCKGSQPVPHQHRPASRSEQNRPRGHALQQPRRAEGLDYFARKVVSEGGGEEKRGFESSTGEQHVRILVGIACAWSASAQTARLEGKQATGR